ncbi:MAG: glycosyltransferase family 4 protein [Deltaproteobacteria bacterium]|nr:glycosyltransferase family 4 protein [Deltaproteobacteria bacterium]
MEKGLPKVCHIVSGDLWGGAEAVVYHLSLALRTLGVQISVVTFNEGRLQQLMEEDGVDVTVIDESKHSLPRLAGEVRGRLNRESPVILHSHGYKENMVAFAASRLLPAVRLVATLHGWPEVYGRRLDLKYRVLNHMNLSVISRFFDRLVCVSEDMRRILIGENGKVGSKTEVIRNGIDVQIDGRRPEREEKFVIGSCGRFVPVKDFPFFIAVAASVRARNGTVLFRLAGDGPEFDTVRELVRAHNLEDAFSCLGAVDDMEGFYRGLDVYINTSLHEGIPVSVLEAMLHGLPVVAPCVGGLGEVITDGIDGYLIDERTPSRYADRCLELMEDFELYDSMSRAAVMKVKTSFSAERMARDYLALYRTMV